MASAMRTLPTDMAAILSQVQYLAHPEVVGVLPIHQPFGQPLQDVRASIRDRGRGYQKDGVSDRGQTRRAVRGGPTVLKDTVKRVTEKVIAVLTECATGRRGRQY